MKFNIPTVDGLKSEGINAAGLFVGVLGGYALQNFLMKERTAKDGTTKKPIIADSILFNGIGAVVGLGLAAASTSPFVKFVGLGLATIFLIRTVNRATDKLSGMEGLGSLKATLDKIVPRLNGDAFDIPMGNVDYINEPMMLPMNGYDDFGRTEAAFSPAADRVALPIPGVNAPARSGRHA